MYVDRKEYKNWQTEATEKRIMIIVERVSVNESDRGGTRGRKYPDSMKNEGTCVRTLPVGDLKL